MITLVVDHARIHMCSSLKNALKKIKVEDLNSFGLHYTWIQSKLNPSSGILKKLDKVLGNGNFMGTFPSAHAIFLPRLSSDYCPVVLFIPNIIIKKTKTFKFANYVVEKPKFMEVVKKYGS
nr:RNA-directed DNA polymerase, eukaryota, reverse transcriptase zinc-binding domain protein [Tanacetum cinerariifolium]